MDGDRIDESVEPIISPFNWRVLLLAAYLFLLLAFSSYQLGSLMLADTTDSEANGKTLASCKANTNPTATPEPKPPTNTAPANSNANTFNTNVSNSDTNTSSLVNTNTSPNTNTAAASPTKTNFSNGASEGKPTPNTDPNTPNSGQMPPIPKVVKVDGGYLLKDCLTGDGYVFLIVLFAGMVGAAIRVVFSFLVHLGRKDFGFNWTWYYIFLPYFGGALSLVIYFVIRGGFYSGGVGNPLYINVFSFAALGALTGLFSDQAMEKLKLVAESLLTKTEAKTSQAKINKLTIPASIILTVVNPTKQLSASATDVQSNLISGLSASRFQWSSDNPTVASVNQTGLVEWKTPGNCNITATNDAGIISNSCKVQCD
jgi:hypothetical protein